MRVAFSAAAMADLASLRHLTAIFWLLQDNAHTWSIEDLAAVERSTWLTGEGRSLRRDLLDRARDAARRTERAQLIVEPVGAAHHHDGQAWHLAADEAERWLREPLLVVVENAKVDGSFLRLVLLRVGERSLKRRLGEAFFQSLKQRWTSPLGDGLLFEVRHGGGSTTATQVTLSVEASPKVPPRLAVLVDSDKHSHDAEPGNTASKVAEAIAALPDFGVAWRPVHHQLQKHEVENYLPDAAIKRVFRRQWDMRRAAGAPPWPDDFEDRKLTFSAKMALKIFAEADDLLYAQALREGAGRELDELVNKLLQLL